MEYLRKGLKDDNKERQVSFGKLKDSQGKGYVYIYGITYNEKRKSRPLLIDTLPESITEIKTFEFLCLLLSLCFLFFFLRSYLFITLSHVILFSLSLYLLFPTTIFFLTVLTCRLVSFRKIFFFPKNI